MVRFIYLMSIRTLFYVLSSFFLYSFWSLLVVEYTIETSIPYLTCIGELSKDSCRVVAYREDIGLLFVWLIHLGILLLLAVTSGAVSRKYDSPTVKQALRVSFCAIIIIYASRIFLGTLDYLSFAWISVYSLGFFVTYKYSKNVSYV